MTFVGDQNKFRIKIYREFYHSIVYIVNDLIESYLISSLC